MSVTQYTFGNSYVLLLLVTVIYYYYHQIAIIIHCESFPSFDMCKETLKFLNYIYFLSKQE